MTSLAMLLLILLPQDSLACSCAATPPKKAFAQAEVVAVVNQRRHPAIGSKLWTEFPIYLEIKKVLKGRLPSPSIELARNRVHQMCSPFIANETSGDRVVFLHGTKDEKLELIDHCHGTTLQVEGGQVVISGTKISIMDLASHLGSEAKESPISEQETKLKTGTVQEKEEVINRFMESPRPELVPALIEATLDDSGSIKKGDSGWGRTYHHAATALCKFAMKLGERTEKECTSPDYTFYSSVGTADLEMRKRVRGNWSSWWNTYSARSRR